VPHRPDSAAHPYSDQTAATFRQTAKIRRRHACHHRHH
jgi:hypothetical protein